MVVIDEVLGESVEDNSWLVDVVDITTVDVDSIIDVELVSCEMIVVETGVMVELVTEVVEKCGTVVGRTVVNVITVDVDLGTEVVDGDGLSQIIYSQSNVYEPALITNTCKQFILTIESNNKINLNFQQLTLTKSCSDKGPLINATSLPLEDDLLYTKLKSSAATMKLPEEKNSKSPFKILVFPS